MDKIVVEGGVRLGSTDASHGLAYSTSPSMVHKRATKSLADLHNNHNTPLDTANYEKQVG